ncbi:MAG: hypothetical protein H7Z75_22410 [Ferruginibacter sp.]|nr:hypothetical protein [Cytophagales bacterium]
MKQSVFPFRSELVIRLSWVVFACVVWSCKDQEHPRPVEDPVKLSKIVWGPNDYQEFTYNTRGQIVRYVSQWTYIDDGSGATKKMTADFQYDHTSHLAKVIFGGGFYVKYHYQGNVLKKSEEYTSKDRLALTHTYQFGIGQRVTEVLTQVHDPLEEAVSQIKKTYAYDGRGNVIQEKVYGKLSPREAFYLSTITAYEDYDQQQTTGNLTDFFPYLPQAKMNVNNPGKQTVLGSDGSTVLSVRTFTYQYNQKGYPTQRTVQVQSDPPVPVSSASYQYQ